MSISLKTLLDDVTRLPELNVVVFALLLNLPWEFFQGPLFEQMPGAPHWQAIKACSRATLSDAAIMLPVYWTVAAARGNRSWIGVPYKGGAPAIQDLIGGQIASSFLVMGEALPHAQSGKLRLLATSGARRSPLLPQLPTFREAGVDFDLQGWFGFFVPSRTQAQRVEQLAAAIALAQASPELVEGYARIGYELPAALPPSAFAARVRADDERWKRIVKESGFTPDG